MDVETGRNTFPLVGLRRSALAMLTSKNFGVYLITAALFTTFIFFSKEISTGLLLWICLSCSFVATCLRVYMVSQNQRVIRLYENNNRFTSLLPLNLQLTLIDRDFNENDYETLLALDSDNTNRNGATREQIDSLPLNNYFDKKVDVDSCSICLELMNKGEQIRTLPCAHFFHSACVDRWLVSCAKCPVCKYAI